MKTTNLIPLSKNEQISIRGGGILFESIIWAIAAYVGASRAANEAEMEVCGEDKRFNRRHGVCH